MYKVSLESVSRERGVWQVSQFWVSGCWSVILHQSSHWIGQSSLNRAVSRLQRVTVSQRIVKVGSRASPPRTLHYGEIPGRWADHRIVVGGHRQRARAAPRASHIDRVLSPPRTLGLIKPRVKFPVGGLIIVRCRVSSSIKHASRKIIDLLKYLIGVRYIHFAVYHYTAIENCDIVWLQFIAYRSTDDGLRGRACRRSRKHSRDTTRLWSSVAGHSSTVNF